MNTLKIEYLKEGNKICINNSSIVCNTFVQTFPLQFMTKDFYDISISIISISENFHYSLEFRKLSDNTFSNYNNRHITLNNSFTILELLENVLLIYKDYFSREFYMMLKSYENKEITESPLFKLFHCILNNSNNKELNEWLTNMLYLYRNNTIMHTYKLIEESTGKHVGNMIDYVNCKTFKRIISVIWYDAIMKKEGKVSEEFKTIEEFHKRFPGIVIY